jgi:hypothetical protein
MRARVVSTITIERASAFVAADPDGLAATAGGPEIMQRSGDPVNIVDLGSV